MAGNLPKIKNDFVKAWLYEVSQQTASDGMTRDLHVDEILLKTTYSKLSSDIRLHTVCFIFDHIAQFIQDATSIDDRLMSYMSIPLMGENTDFVGPPQSLKDLEDSIDLYSIPELIVYKEQASKNTPIVELHRMPIQFEIFDFSSKNMVLPFYIESKILVGEWKSDEYTRVLNLLFNYP